VWGGGPSEQAPKETRREPSAGSLRGRSFATVYGSRRQNLDLTTLPAARCERIRVGLVASASSLRARLRRSATFDWETTLADHLPTLETYLDRAARIFVRPRTSYLPLIIQVFPWPLVSSQIGVGSSSTSRPFWS
jgi:hypothetical protein